MASSVSASSLRSHIEKTSLECLNQDDRHPLTNAIENTDPSLYLQSCVDSELLIKCAFQQAARLERISISACKLNDTWDTASAPARVKVYVNQINMGFDDVESTPPSYEAELKGTDYDGTGTISLTLNVAKFRNVQSLVMYFEHTCGGIDVTRIGSIDLFGKLVESTNMSDWKPLDKNQEYHVPPS